MTDRTGDPSTRPARNALDDVPGVGVGHHQRIGRGWLTGCTVIVPPPGTIGSVDVRGGAPGTRETDLLDPRMMIDHVDAVCLSGGSAYGLACADGVMGVLERHSRGHPVGPDGRVVPIVPGAVIFDLGRGGAFGNRPDAAFGARAATSALTNQRRRAPAPSLGAVGAGAGAMVGGLRGGLGSASVVAASGAVVAALAVVNAAGSAVDPRTGELYGLRHLLRAERRAVGRPSRADARAAADALATLAAERTPRNTTLVVVATTADLTKAECHKLAGIGHDGLARALSPVHLQVDGDVVFTLATADHRLVSEPGADVVPDAPAALASTRVRAFDELLALAGDAVSRAVVRAVLAAPGTSARPSYLDLYPSARRASALA